MLPPMRPSPIIPSCIASTPLFEGLFKRRRQCREPGFDALSKMDAQHPPAALGEDAEIAACLCRLDHPEGIFLPRHRQILRVRTGDLQDHTAVRPALVDLTGRMQEARAEAETGRDFLLVA